jgi:diguanylate cyclase (GGDEF)-like protein
MTNAGVIACYAPFLLVLIGLTVYAAKKAPLGRYRRNILFLYGSLIGWLFFLCLFYASTTPEAAAFLYDLHLPFVSLTTLAVFLLAMRFYHCDMFLSRQILLVLLVIPLLTAVVSSTNLCHDFLRPYMTIVSVWPLHVVDKARGVWFWVHTAYSYALVLLTMGVALVQHCKLPPIFRLPSKFLLVAMMTSLCGNVLVLTGAFPVPLDFSLLGACICAMMLFYGCIRNRSMDFLHLARTNIFNSLPKAILILDDEGNLLGKNRKAGAWFAEIGVPQSETAYAAILHAQESCAEKTEERDGGMDFRYPVPTGKRTISLREKIIADKRGRSIGKFIVSADVTENRALIRRLEDEAGVDALTGLANRRQMDRFIEELDKPENLPLAVIMGDLNYLKKVNDTMGHLQGDVLLRVSSAMLTLFCPANARIGRVGGDEFLILLPARNAEETAQIIRQIEERMAAATEHPFEVSMALGMAVKSDEATPLEEVIAEADRVMYENKRKSGKGRNC